MSNTTPLLFETIKIEDNVIHNLYYHQQRFDTSRQTLYPHASSISLAQHINPPPKGCYRCRISYDTQIRSIEYIPYTPKSVNTIQAVVSDIHYTYKYADREVFHRLLTSVASADEILIIKDGYITDTSIANIAFYDGHQWFTPKTPLLAGTMRAKLLDEGFLRLKDISMDDLDHYTHVALMNAMIGFKILKDITILDTKGKTYDY